MKFVSSFIFGFVFSMGLSLSGMTNPNKVQSFLDISGTWDPSLMMVMIGAILVGVLSYTIVPKMKNPVFVETFSIPSRKDIDAPLVIGAMLFGMGWALSGMCPGPVLANLHTAQHSVLIFFLAMMIGLFFGNFLTKKFFSR